MNPRPLSLLAGGLHGALGRAAAAGGEAFVAALVVVKRRCRSLSGGRIRPCLDGVLSFLKRLPLPRPCAPCPVPTHGTCDCLGRAAVCQHSFPGLQEAGLSPRVPSDALRWTRVCRLAPRALVSGGVPAAPGGLSPCAHPRVASHQRVLSVKERVWRCAGRDTATGGPGSHSRDLYAR